MKRDDIVTIQDTSYSTSVVDEKLTYSGRRLRYKRCKVIEVGCTFPKTSKWDGDNVNNTIIQVIETGQVVFIEERFLRPVPPTHKVMVDIRQDGGWMYGQVIEISDKLYKEIKRDSQS